MRPSRIVRDEVVVTWNWPRKQFKVVATGKVVGVAVLILLAISFFLVAMLL